jgi:hypothetical protein
MDHPVKVSLVDLPPESWSRRNESRLG